jgi:hypothetical protein
MSRAKAPTRAPTPTFADEVDRIVHDELNLSSPPARARDLPAGVGELASAFVLIQELLEMHKKLLLDRVRDHLPVPQNDGLVPAKRLLQDLRDGTRGPIWKYIESVRDSRRPKRKTRDDVFNEELQAQIVGLVQALEATFGGSKRRHQRNVAEECARQGRTQITRDKIDGWRAKFEKMENTAPQLFAQRFPRYPNEAEMLLKGVATVLAIGEKTTFGLTGL